MPLTIASIIIRYLEYIYSVMDFVINLFKKIGAKIGTVTVKLEHIKKEPGRME